MSDLPENKGTILIVDDEPNVLWFISKVCQPMGYETITAGSGAEAMKVLRECGEKLDVVLLDLKMPGMDGMEVLKSIRGNHPDLPVIVLTAVHDKQAECEKLGVEAFLKKPYSLEELYQKIEAIIEDHGLNEETTVLDPDVKPCAKILIVDDEAEVCELLTAALFEDVRDVLFDVKWVRTGEEALRTSLEFKPDIAIIDICLPHMWGDELVKHFKAGEGYCPRDFIIYANVADPAEIEKARRSGHKLLTRPTDLGVLIDLLQKVCIRHNLLRKRSF